MDATSQKWTMNTNTFLSKYPSWSRDPMGGEPRIARELHLATQIKRKREKSFSTQHGQVETREGTEDDGSDTESTGQYKRVGSIWFWHNLLTSQHVCSVLTCLLCLFYLCLHIYTSSESSFYVVLSEWHMPPVRAHRLWDGSVKILFPNSKELNKEVYLRFHHPKRRLILSIFVSHGRSFTYLLDCSDKRPKIWVSRSTTKGLKLLSHIFCTVQVHLPTSVHIPGFILRWTAKDRKG